MKLSDYDLKYWENLQWLLDIINLCTFVSTESYTTIKEIENLKCPTRVNMILKFLHKAEPRACVYFLPVVFANALDPEGDVQLLDHFQTVFSKPNVWNQNN